MGQISDHKVFHGGTYNTNPVAMAAGLATFREVLTPAAYEHVTALNKKTARWIQRYSGQDGPGGVCDRSRVERIADVLREADQELPATG